MLSSNQLKKLGKRLRDGSRTSDDLEMLADYKSGFDEVLFETTQLLSGLLLENEIPAVLSGRSKRTKSLIRKLCREQNQGMDLSRIEDVVGLRLIVQDRRLQDKALELIQTLDFVKCIRDYRVPEREYKAIHIVLNPGGKLIELQIRTCIQHLWAEESESFGERVKEGGGPPLQRQYLHELAFACWQLETTGSLPELQHVFFESRGTFASMLPILQNNYGSASRIIDANNAISTHLVIYDSYTCELIKRDLFGATERADSLKEYKRVLSILDEDRYDVLLLNSGYDEALNVTHSRYFPTGFFR